MQVDLKQGAGPRTFSTQNRQHQLTQTLSRPPGPLQRAPYPAFQWHTQHETTDECTVTEHRHRHDAGLDALADAAYTLSTIGVPHRSQGDAVPE